VLTACSAQACGEDGARLAVETPNKMGVIPLRELVTSPALTDNHLRVMLRVSEKALLHRDRRAAPNGRS